MKRPTTLRLICAMWIAAAVAGWIILMIPEEPRRPLISQSDWRIEGQFFENWRPTYADVHSSILNSPEARFFRSWGPGIGAGTGSIQTTPFQVPRYLSVAIAGTPYDPQISVNIECVASSDRLPVATGHFQDGWTEQILPIPSDWCSTGARLVAESNSDSNWISVGTPFAASWLAYMKGSAPIVVCVHLIVLGPLVLIGSAFVLQFLVWGWEREFAFVGGLVGVLLCGYFSFFVAYFDFRVQIALNTLTVIICALSIFRRRGIAALEFGQEGVRRPLVLYLAVSVAAIAAVYAVDTGSGGWAPNYRFAPAQWSSDNQLQPMISELLYRGDSVLNWNQLWQTSDRPPLLSGILLLSRPWWEPVLAANDNKRLLDLFYQCAAISIMAFWVVPVWYFVQNLKLTRWRSLSVFLLFAIAPFTVFNTVYAWPKLLSGWLAFLVFVLILHRRLDTRRGVEPPMFVLGVTLATLALLSHGGVVFGLIPMAVLMLSRRFWPGWKPLILGTAVAASLLAPWIAWQKLVDPPGNHLVKFAFAGTYGEGEDHIGVWETVQRKYRPMSFQEWVQTRREAVQTLFLGFWWPTTPGDALDRMRRDDLLYVVTSMRVLNLGWASLLAILISLVQRRELASTHRTALVMVSLGAGGVLLNCLTTMPYHIIPTQSYLSIMFLILGLAIAVSSRMNRGLVLAVVFCQIAYTGLVWGIAPLDLSVNNRMDLVALCTFAAAAAVGNIIAMKPVQQSARQHAGNTR